MPQNLATNITNTLDLEFDRRCRPQAPLHLTELSLSGKPIHAKAKVDCHLGGSCILATRLMGSVAIQSRRVYAATLTFDGPRHEFREQCCIKMAYGHNEYFALKREYRFYSHALRDLGGIAVPRCYGFFSAEVGELVGCLVLDLCVGATHLKGIQRNKLRQRQELNRQIMIAICKLHTAGVTHRNLDDYHHFVMQGQSVLIVDFSQAIMHNCSGGTPFVEGNDIDRWKRALVDCAELYRCESNFGDHVTSKPPRSRARTL